MKILGLGKRPDGGEVIAGEASGSVFFDRMRGLGKRALRTLTMALFPLASLTLLVITWKLVQVMFDMPHYLLPAPESVAQLAAIDQRSLLADHMTTTLQEVLLGFGLAVLVAVPLAVVMASWRVMEMMLYPVLVASQGVPKSAVAPVLVIWLGFGIEPKIAIAALISFFPIVVATFVGLRSIQPEMVDLGRSMGMSWFSMLRKVKLPNALPNIFGGLKVGMSLAVVGAVVAEFIAAERGLGYLILTASSQLRTDLVFAAVVYVAAMGIVLFTAIDILEKVTTPWYTRRQIARDQPA